jgi:hypothetical protein
VESLIHVIRGQKVMLDADLSALYGVETRVLNQAVRRNSARFPADFVFHLTKEETANLKSQSVTSSCGGRRKAPAAFTELGVAMLSSVLHSERAVQMNIVIMRAFVKLREVVAHHKDIAARMEKLERGHARTASVIEVPQFLHVEDIDRLALDVKQMKALPPLTKRKIGFRSGNG